MEKSSTAPSSMPITPRHAQVIDEVLSRVLQRLQDQAIAIGYSAPPLLSLEQLRQSRLAKLLRSVARLAEGYDLQSNVTLPNIEEIARLLYPDQRVWPDHFHETPLGEMIHEALARAYPRSHRIIASEAARLLGVSRQTVHSWAGDGTLTPIYERGAVTFVRHQVEQLRQRRADRDRARETGKPMEKDGNPGR